MGLQEVAERRHLSGGMIAGADRSQPAQPRDNGGRHGPEHSDEECVAGADELEQHINGAQRHSNDSDP